MDPSTAPSCFILPAAVFVVALLYSSVGHGGASGYLAVMSLLAVNPDQMATTALILNLLVAGLSLLNYARAKHFSWALTWPFILGSVPAAFVGGILHVSSTVYHIVLAVVLILAAYRLAVYVPKPGQAEEMRPISLPVALGTGAGLGIVSGMVGIGGGIFLSPLMLLMVWADAKKTSATSACFIVVNSLAGLGGRAVRHGLELGFLAPLVVAAFAGGLAGSHLGATRFSGVGLRRMLAGVLIIAAFKLVYMTLTPAHAP